MESVAAQLGLPPLPWEHSNSDKECFWSETSQKRRAEAARRCPPPWAIQENATESQRNAATLSDGSNLGVHQPNKDSASYPHQSLFDDAISPQMQSEAQGLCLPPTWVAQENGGAGSYDGATDTENQQRNAATQSDSNNFGFHTQAQSHSDNAPWWSWQDSSNHQLGPQPGNPSMSALSAGVKVAGPSRQQSGGFNQQEAQFYSDNASVVGQNGNSFTLVKPQSGRHSGNVANMSASSTSMTVADFNQQQAQSYSDNPPWAGKDGSNFTSVEPQWERHSGNVAEARESTSSARNVAGPSQQQYTGFEPQGQWYSDNDLYAGRDGNNFPSGQPQSGNVGLADMPSSSAGFNEKKPWPCANVPCAGALMADDNITGVIGPRQQEHTAKDNDNGMTQEARTEAAANNFGLVGAQHQVDIDEQPRVDVLRVDPQQGGAAKDNNDRLDKPKPEAGPSKPVPRRAAHKERYYCQVAGCSAGYIRSYDLRYHVAQVHSAGAKEALKCDWPGCTKSYASKYALKSHREVKHERKFARVCDLCGKTYATPDSLNTHRPLCKRGEKRPRKKREAPQ